MRLLVTRPRPDAEHTAELLRHAGHEPIVTPLLEIVPANPPGEIPQSGVQAYLVTSANGARALAAATDRHDVRVFAVGDASAGAARDAGFADVQSADGDVDDLAGLVRECLDPADGMLVHAVGSVSAGNLAGTLAAAGFDARAVVLYEARVFDVLPAAAGEALRDKRADGVLLYSPRTARSFAALAEKAGLAPALGSVRAFCLSDAVAKALPDRLFAGVQVADRPDQAALFELFGV